MFVGLAPPTPFASAYRQLRKALFTASRPSGEYLVVDRSVAEIEPTENGNDHIDGVGFDFDRGMDTLASFLEEAGIEYETRTVETNGDGH